MFIILLKFADNKAQASEFMEGHNQWIKQGFSDGIFLLVGSMKPNMGGAIIAYGEPIKMLEERVQADPFVANHIVSTEIIEVDPKKADPKLNFLMEN